MDFFFFFIMAIGFIIYNGVKNSGKKSAWADKGGETLTSIQKIIKENAEKNGFGSDDDWSFDNHDSHNDSYDEDKNIAWADKTPTQRGRERMAKKGIKLYKPSRHQPKMAVFKSPKMHGRRGMNMDQNRQRSDGWGEKGDRGSGNGLIIGLILLGIGLFVLSNISPEWLQSLGL